MVRNLYGGRSSENRGENKMSKRRKPLIKPEDLPSHIIILGQKFRIEVCDMDENDYGETLGYERLIKISKHQSKELVMHTLFHEAVHAALHVTGQTSLLSDNMEEAVVMAMEAAFAEAIDIDKLAIDEEDQDDS